MKKILFIVPLILLFSCSVQKRKYQKGFYVSTNKSKTHLTKNKPATPKNEINPAPMGLTQHAFVTDEIILEASTATDLRPVKAKAPVLYYNVNDTCDVITLKNGDEVRAHVLEITPIDIKYKKCDLPDGPLYIVKKQDVFMIRYTNGTKEVIKEEAPNPNLGNTKTNTANNANNNSNYKGPKKMHPLAIVAFVCSILGFFTYGIGFILGSIFANIAIKRIREQPDRYKGETLAKVAKIIGYVALGILAFILLVGLVVLFLGA